MSVRELELLAEATQFYACNGHGLGREEQGELNALYSKLLEARTSASAPAGVAASQLNADELKLLAEALDFCIIYSPDVAPGMALLLSPDEAPGKALLLREKLREKACDRKRQQIPVIRDAVSPEQAEVVRARRHNAMFASLIDAQDSAEALEDGLRLAHEERDRLAQRVAQLEGENAALGVSIDNLNAAAADLAAHGRKLEDERDRLTATVRDLEARLQSVTADMVAIAGALPEWCGEGSIAERVVSTVRGAEQIRASTVQWSAHELELLAETTDFYVYDPDLVEEDRSDARALRDKIRAIIVRRS